jgi:predicted esterase
MTYTIELTPDLEQRAAQEARQNGKSIAEYLPELLDRALPKTSHVALNTTIPKTGADLLALWEEEGAFVSRDDQPESPVLAHHLREQAQRRGLE